MAAQTETNFALTFLQQLSARQQKYASDFVAPPSTLSSKPLIVRLSQFSLTNSSFLQWSVPNANAPLPNPRKQEVLASPAGDVVFSDG